MEELTAATGKDINIRIPEQERPFGKIAAQTFKASEDAADEAEGHTQTENFPVIVERSKLASERPLKRQENEADADLARGHKETDAPKLVDRGRQESEHFLQREKDQAAADAAKGDAKHTDKFSLRCQWIAAHFRERQKANAAKSREDIAEECLLRRQQIRAHCIERRKASAAKSREDIAKECLLRRQQIRAHCIERRKASAAANAAKRNKDDAEECFNRRQRATEEFVERQKEIANARAHGCVGNKLGSLDFDVGLSNADGSDSGHLEDAGNVASLKEDLCNAEIESDQDSKAGRVVEARAASGSDEVEEDSCKDETESDNEMLAVEEKAKTHDGNRKRDEHEAQARATEEGYVLINIQEDREYLTQPAAHEGTPLPLGLTAVLRRIKEAVRSLLGLDRVDADLAHIV